MSDLKPMREAIAHELVRQTGGHTVEIVNTKTGERWLGVKAGRAPIDVEELLAVLTRATPPPSGDVVDIAYKGAERVREALDRKACPDAWMRIAFEAAEEQIKAALSALPVPALGEDEFEIIVNEHTHFDKASGSRYVDKEGLYRALLAAGAIKTPSGAK